MKLIIGFIFFIQFSLFAEESTEAEKNRNNALQVAGSYFSEAPKLIQKQGLTKNEIIQKLRSVEVDVRNSRIIHKTEKGEVVFSYKVDEKINSAEMTFNISDSTVSEEESALMKSFEKQLKSVKSRPRPRSRISQIKDEENSMSVQVVRTNGPSGSRVRKIIFEEDFFKDVKDD